jgi:uncharacterized protein YgiM (DUF1202 family)
LALALACLLALFPAGAALAASPQTSVGIEAEVTANGVNIRSGPSTAYDTLGKLQKGQVIWVKKLSDRWAQVALDESGKAYVYVHRDYIKFRAFGPIELDVPNTDGGSLGAYMATGRVNVRTGPGTGYNKLGQLKRGQSVAVWKIEGKWAEITWETGDIHAYVHSDYLKPAPATTPAMDRDTQQFYKVMIAEAMQFAGLPLSYTLKLNADGLIMTVEASLRQKAEDALRSYGVNMREVAVAAK